MTTDNTASKELELLPCPFCGASAGNVPLSRGHGFIVGCGSCQAQQFAMSRDEAVTAWNSRAAVAAPRGDALKLLGKFVRRIRFELRDDPALLSHPAWQNLIGEANALMSSPVAPSLIAEQERETLIYWLLRCYESGHRQGWEPGPSTDETMDGLLSVLANRGYDPNIDEAAKELLKRPARYNVARYDRCGDTGEVSVGCAIDTALTVPCPSCSGMPRRWCAVHKREEFKYESLEHELVAATPATATAAKSLLRDPVKVDVSKPSAPPPLIVTRDGVPCADQAAALEEFKERCRASNDKVAGCVHGIPICRDCQKSAATSGAREAAKTLNPNALLYTARQLRDDVLYQYLDQSPEPGLFEFLNWLTEQEEKANDQV